MNRKWVWSLMLVLLVVSAVLNIVMYRHIKSFTTTEKRDTVTVVRWKEVKDTVPQVITERVVSYVTIPTGKAVGTVAEPDTLPSEPEPEKQGGIVLPIIQRKYSDDSTYTAYVSGAKIEDYPRLDSIIVRQKEIERTITITKTIKQKRKNWNIGLQAGYGYGFVSKQVEPYVGVGISVGL